MDSQIKFASVRYFDDESKRIHIVPIEKIKNFAILEKYENPYFVKRLNPITMEESMIAAQIMEIGNNEEDLKHNKQRYVFKKMRYSDAVQKILEELEDLESDKIQKETEFNNNERTSEEDDENINEKFKSSNNDVKISDRNHEKFPKIPKSIVDKKIDEDIINEKLEILNRDNIVFEKNREKLLENPIVPEKEIQYLKEENKKLELENHNLKNDIFLLKEELNTLKTKKQLFPEELKRPASPITSTPKKIRNETNARLQDTVFNECSTSQPMYEQFSLQGDFCTQMFVENNDQTHKAKHQKTKSKKKDKKKQSTLKKSKKDKGKKKNKGSDLDYDSDQYIGLTDKENMTTWNDEVNGTIIKMMHLRYGISIPYTTWKEIKKLRTPSLFVRHLSRALWGVHKLMNRALLLERSTNRLPNRSPRKPLTPVKKAVLKKCYSAFIEIHHNKEKKKLLNKWRRYLSIYINFLIETKIKEEEEKHRKRQSPNSSDSTSSRGCDSSSASSESSSDDD